MEPGGLAPLVGPEPGEGYESLAGPVCVPDADAFLGVQSLTVVLVDGSENFRGPYRGGVVDAAEVGF